MNILDQLRRDEGEVLHAYEDSLGYLTIGVGHLIDSRRGGGISKAASDFILQEDVAAIRDALHANLDWFDKLDPARQDVLVNMGFALGFHGLLGFHNLLSMLEKFESVPDASAVAFWNDCAKEIESSKWATQVGDRAKRLAQQLRSGEWQ